MTESFAIENLKEFKSKVLHYVQNVRVFCLLDSNYYYNGKDLLARPYYHSYDYVAAIGASRILRCKAGKAFLQMEQFMADNPSDWLFGYFGYDLKNELENLSSTQIDHVGFDDLFFFVPEVILLIKENKVTIKTKQGTPVEVFKDIENQYIDSGLPAAPASIPFKSRVPWATYVDTVEKLRSHIVEGDVYEVSYCQEFYAENAVINPFTVFTNLAEDSPQPFGAYMRMDDRYILCASMERFLKKTGNTLISQPIKGTIRRGDNAHEDEMLRAQLLQDEKERAENVMIVDLVRNDLSRTCQSGTVKVEELFGIYGFKGVFQMMSTVTGVLLPGITGLEAIKAAFPMGSMTGAPKIMAMNIIDRYEASRRGAYSGALGYFAPNGDFDFNVVIRTLLYQARSNYLSLHVGSAITYDSDPQKEYEECMIKIKNIKKAL